MTFAGQLEKMLRGSDNKEAKEKMLKTLATAVRITGVYFCHLISRISAFLLLLRLLLKVESQLKRAVPRVFGFDFGKVAPTRG